MTSRSTILALAALTTLSVSAFAPTAASAGEFGHGYFGNDYGRYSRVWNPPRHVDPCECEAPVRHTYVPVKVPVYVPVKVKVPVYVPVKVKVPVYVPVKQPVAEPCDCEEPAPSHTRYVPAPRPSHIEAAPQQTAEPCDCEEPEFTAQPGRGQQIDPGYRPGNGPQYDQNRRQVTSLSGSELEKK